MIGARAGDLVGSNPCGIRLHQASHGPRQLANARIVLGTLRGWALAGSPVVKYVTSLDVYRKKAFDAQLLQCNVLWCAQGGNGGKQAQGSVAFAKMQRRDRALSALFGARFSADRTPS
jgi:hypothetical protein